MGAFVVKQLEVGLEHIQSQRGAHAHTTSTRNASLAVVEQYL